MKKATALYFSPTGGSRRAALREIKSAPGWKAISVSRRNWFGGRKTGSGRKGEAWPHSFAF